MSTPETNTEAIEEWTVQEKKARRLAPQFTLSRQDLGADSPKSKAAQETATKKKVKRFLKEELLAMRKCPKDLSVKSLLIHTDIISITPIEPSSMLSENLDEVDAY